MQISNREKVILGITTLAAIWAGGSFLFSGAGDTPDLSEAGREAPQQMALQAAQSLGQNSLTDGEQAVLERARAAWPADPFIREGKNLAEEKTGSSAWSGEDIPLIYNGYIETGSMQLAIINGDEYAPGDRITGTAYSLRQVSPDKVLLADADNNVVAVSMAVDPMTGHSSDNLPNSE